MAGLLGYAAAGAAAGLGQSIIERARAAETRAMEALKREWQLQDRSQERAWSVEDRDQGRAWDLEDSARTRGQAVEDAQRERDWQTEDRNAQADAIDSALGGGLVGSESGGDFGARNDAVGAGGHVGHFGRAQFGVARLEDAKNAGVIPRSLSAEQFLRDPEAQKRVEQWHRDDILAAARQNGTYDLIGKEINGVPVTEQGLINVAHLGGKGGAEKFFKSGGQYDPADDNGTRLSDYLALGAREAGGGPSRADRVRMARAEMTRAGVPVAEQSAILADALPEEKVPDPFTLGSGQQRFDGRGNLIAEGPAAESDLPASIREYLFAQEQGETRSYAQWKADMSRAGATSVNVGGDNMPKPPSGFVQVENPDGTMGFAPIAGGPGTQISAEIAGRIALADDAIKQLPDLIAQAENGDLTGPVDWLRGRAGYGAPGEARRENMAGAEAITRMLTGAGMNLAEAEREKDLYIIGIRDTAETAASKLRQLQRRLEGLVETAKRGREGVSVDPKTGMGISGQEAPSAPPGTIDLGSLPPEVSSQLSQSAPGQRVQGPDGATYVWDGKALRAER